jgi:acyl-coenzyme A thioesterase PaaI-like protein
VSSDRAGIDGVSEWFGIRWQHRNETRMTIRPELINAGGMLSGVATYALVDYTMGSTLWAQTTEEEGIATVNIANRSAATMRSEVRHDDGRLMATAIGSYAIFPRRR